MGVGLALAAQYKFHPPVSRLPVRMGLSSGSAVITCLVSFLLRRGGQSLSCVGRRREGGAWSNRARRRVLDHAKRVYESKAVRGIPAGRMFALFSGVLSGCSAESPPVLDMLKAVPDPPAKPLSRKQSPRNRQTRQGQSMTDFPWKWFGARAAGIGLLSPLSRVRTCHTARSLAYVRQFSGLHLHHGRPL